DDRAQERVPEDAVVEHGAEVVQADPLTLVPDQLEEAVMLEREPDEEVERVGEDRADHGDRRREEQVGPGEPGDGKTTPPERECGSGGVDVRSQGEVLATYSSSASR